MRRLSWLKGSLAPRGHVCLHISGHCGRSTRQSVGPHWQQQDSGLRHLRVLTCLPLLASVVSPSVLDRHVLHLHRHLKVCQHYLDGMHTGTIPQRQGRSVKIWHSCRSSTGDKLLASLRHPRRCGLHRIRSTSCAISRRYVPGWRRQ